MKTYLAIFMAATLVTSVTANTIAAEAAAIEEVVVRAARTPVTLARLGSAITVLNADLLENRQTYALSEILRGVPGLAVSRSGVVGSLTAVRMRGGEANQVMVYIDGIEANDPSGGGSFDFAHLLNQDIERVEIIRGPQSALWGSDALSGVIHITTKQAQSGLGAKVFAEAGSHSLDNVGGSVGYANKRLNTSLSLSRVNTDGENISRHGKEQDGYDNRTIQFGLDYQINNHIDLDIALRQVDAASAFDRIVGGLPADADNQTDTEQRYGRFTLNLHSLDRRWLHSLTSAVTDTDNATRSEIFSGVGGFEPRRAAAKKTLLSYQTTFVLTRGESALEHSITAVLERQKEAFKQRGVVKFYGDPNRNEEMGSNSYVAEYLASFGNTSLQAGLRRDQNSDFGDTTTERVSLAYRPAGGHIKLRAAYGSGITNPTFIERYGFFTNFVGNPGLRPEHSRGWEVGIDQQLAGGKARLSLTWFSQRLEDEINGFVRADPLLFIYTAKNSSGSSYREGAELEGNWQPARNLRLRLAYTYLQATEHDSDSDRQQPELRRPRHNASANLGWGFLQGRGQLSLNVDYNGAMRDEYFPPYPDASRIVTLDSFTLLTLAASYSLGSGLAVYGRIENALHQDYEEVFGYRAPGLNTIVGVKYHWNN